jgi:hypothetical protein
MRGANLSALRLAAALSLAAAFAQASPPPSGGTSDQTGSARPPRRSQEIQSIGVDPLFTTFAGVVLDIHDKAVPGTQVDLFVDGERLAAGMTGPDGYYEIKCRYDFRADATALLWYIPADRTLLPKVVVLNESKVSQENQLISPCVARAKFTPGHQFRVYLFDPANRIKELEEVNCLP